MKKVELNYIGQGIWSLWVWSNEKPVIHIYPDRYDVREMLKSGNWKRTYLQEFILQ